MFRIENEFKQLSEIKNPPSEKKKTTNRILIKFTIPP